MATFTKTPVTTFQTTDFRGNVNTFYSAKIENTTYQCLSLEDLELSLKNHREVKTDASAFYGIGQYNGD